MFVARDYQFRLCRYCASENLIIVRVLLDDSWNAGWHDKVGDALQIRHDALR